LRRILKQADPRVLRLLSRRKPPAALPLLDAPVPVDAATASTTARPVAACALSACIAGSRATVLEVRCGGSEACRLRALGLCEGASVNVVRSRDCTLLEVRGSRLALSAAIASGITVLPVA
jgi:ferrous iron transport protein A